MLKAQIDEFISVNKDEKLASFNRKLVTTKYPIYGIKTPTLRKFATALARQGVSPCDIEPRSHEEILLRSMVLARTKMSPEKTIDEFKKYINKIDNWATCDMSVCELKALKSDAGHKFFMEELRKNVPFRKRIGIVGLMTYFLPCAKDDYKKIAISGDYYVQMAVAWYLATLCTHDFNLAYKFISSLKDEKILKMTISKCRDSRRLTPEQKNMLNKLKK